MGFSGVFCSGCGVVFLGWVLAMPSPGASLVAGQELLLQTGDKKKLWGDPIVPFQCLKEKRGEIFYKGLQWQDKGMDSD